MCNLVRKYGLERIGHERPEAKARLEDMSPEEFREAVKKLEEQEAESQVKPPERGLRRRERPRDGRFLLGFFVFVQLSLQEAP